MSNRGLLSVICIALSACASNQKNFAEFNRQFAEAKFPVRYTLEKTETTEAWDTVWAGEVAPSAAYRSDILFEGIITNIEKKCGYGLDELVETRVVSHEALVFYEVWVFADEKSKRKDKRSAQTVYMKAWPDQTRTEYQLIGPCQASYPSFMFSE